MLIMSPASSQIEGKINKILLKNNFKAFLAFSNDYRLEKDSVQIRKGNIREIVSGFEEGMFYIIKTYPLVRGIHIRDECRLNIITKGNQIIFYTLENKRMDISSSNLGTTEDSTYSFSNKKEMDDLKKRFTYLYGVPLDEKGLFIDTITLGTKCGHYPGEMLKQQEQVVHWANKKDTLSLNSWLTSANTETQLFAMRGYYYLSLRGVKISKKTQEIIKHLATKKGTVYTCIPCDVRSAKISDAAKPFVF